MGRRLGRLTGLFAIALVLWRLGRLLQSGPEMVRWQLILVAAVLLGGLIWWLFEQLPLSNAARVSLFVLGAVVLILRISVPATLVAGVLPSPDTLPALGSEMGDAIRDIRFGVPPVLPSEGITAILAGLMWAVGAAYAWGANRGPVLAMTLPSIVVYLQFAVFDRVPAGALWLTASTLMLVAAIASIALDRKAETGRARDVGGRAIPRRSAATALVMAGVVGLMAVGAATGGAGLVSEYGNLPWRTGGSGLGGPGGGVAFEPFVDLRQSLIERSNVVLFQATLGEGGPPPETLYWRLQTLDDFDGVGWGRSSGRILNYDEEIGAGEPYQRYQGTTTDILQKVRIEALGRDVAPTAGVPVEIHDLAESDGIDPIQPQEFRVTQDAALFYPPFLRQGDAYQLVATYADQDADLGMLATGPDGELSPIFQGAVDAGAVSLRPDISQSPAVEPPNIDQLTRLPDDTPPSLRGIAALRTQGATTDFERAWMLQHWFRDSGDFTYSTRVSTGHDPLRLDEWLTEPESQNYRTGYCEQFAASMAVLGRALGIPSRVVLGFTPGTVTDSGVIQVRDTNAHAWVEMWMSCCGWVRFDPTPRGESQPVSLTAGFDPVAYLPERPPGESLQGFNDPTLLGEDSTAIEDLPPIGLAGDRSRTWLLALPAAAALIGLIPLGKWVRRRRRLARVRAGDVTAIWEEIIDRLSDLGEPVPRSKTPIEFARDTDNALIPLAYSYSAVVYGNRPGAASENDLLTVEGWLARRYDTGRRVRAALSPRSFIEDL